MRGCYVQMPKRLGKSRCSSLKQKGKRGDHRRAVDVAVVPLVFCALRFSSYFLALIRCFRHATLFVLFILFSLPDTIHARVILQALCCPQIRFRTFLRFRLRHRNIHLRCSDPLRPRDHSVTDFLWYRHEWYLRLLVMGN